MEELFQRSINEINKLRKFSEDDLKLFELADKVADEIYPEEVNFYLERKFNHKSIDIMKKYNLFGIPVAKEYGGREASPIVSTLVYERLGQVGLGPWSVIAVSIGLAGTCVEIWGTEELKDKYLRPAAKGEIILAYALTEPMAGSDPTALTTTYEEKGGEYIVNGAKYLITNGSIAD